MPRNDLSMLEFLCSDVLKVARFWSALLEIPLDHGASEEHAQLTPPSPQPAWVFARVDSDGGGSGYVIALTSYDLDDDAARAVTLGATSSRRHAEDGHEWVELRDPEGHRFTFNHPTHD